MKKAIPILLTAAGIIMLAAGAIPKMAAFVTEVSSAIQAVSVIGGSDGPTAIFIAGKIGGPDLGWISIIAGIIMLVLGVIMFRKNRQK